MSERITVNLPDQLAQTVRRRARKAKQSVSHIVVEALRAQELADLHERMKQGYIAMAGENKRLAEEALPAIREILPDD